MALDRFIYRVDKWPFLDELVKIIKDYIGEAGEVLYKGDRLYIEFPGKTSFALKSVSKMPSPFEGSERWIEVIHTTDSIDVLTRLQDEYTNTIAEGLFKILQRFYEASSDHQIE